MPSGSADIGLVLFASSDQHSNYEMLPYYLRATHSLCQIAKQNSPAVKTLHLLGGDLSGPSPWTILDQGKLNYDVFASLAENSHVLSTLGNHEAFSFNGKKGLELFASQNGAFIDELRRHGHSNFALNVANLVPAVPYENLFCKHNDIVLSSGHTVRFVGLVLETFFNQSAYDRESEPQIISGIESMLTAAQDAVRQAERDSIKSLIFFCHESHARVLKFVQKLLEWKSTHPEFLSVELPLVFSSHDHLVHFEYVESTCVVDSGSDYEFSSLYLSNDGKVLAHEFYGQNNLRRFDWSADLGPVEAAILQMAETRVEELSRILQTQITHNQKLHETRDDFKKRRTRLGSVIAECLCEWAKSQIESLGGHFADFQIKGILAFFNSSAFRRTSSLPTGALSVKDLISISPFPSELRMLVASGAQIQRLHESLLSQRSAFGEYSPQLPSNITVDSNGKLGFLLGDKDRVSHIEPDAEYLLVLDSWLGQNGFKLAEFEEALFQCPEIRVPEGTTLQQVLIDRFAKCMDDYRQRRQG